MSVFERLRFSQWWEYKIPVLIGLYCEGLLAAGLPLWVSIRQLVGIVVLLAGIASLAHVFNDWGDEPYDSKSGQSNRFAGMRWRQRMLWALFLLGVAGNGLFICQAGGIEVGLAVAMIVLFFGYSFPPWRLKSRGGWGVLADAVAVHSLPTLLILVSVWRQVDHFAFAKAGAAMAWLLAWGLRGILWHQLNDLEWDRRAGTATLAVLKSQGSIRKLCERIILPVEITGLLGYLLMAGQMTAWLALLPYGIVEFSRNRLWKVSLIIVEPRPSFRLILQEYYEVLFPFAILISAVLRDWRDAMILVAFVILFPNRLTQWFRDAYLLGSEWLKLAARKAGH